MIGGSAESAARLRWALSRPYFFMKWKRATVETRTFHVRSMKSRISERWALGWVTRNCAIDPA